MRVADNAGTYNRWLETAGALTYDEWREAEATRILCSVHAIPLGHGGWYFCGVLYHEFTPGILTAVITLE